jgi:hypothetical protein
LVPEYPAAQVLLQCLVRRLVNDLNKASSNSSKSPEATYLNTAFDILGKICCVQARILAMHEKKSLPVHVKPLHTSMDSDQVCLDSCYCHDPTLKDKFVIRCDACHEDFHGTCVGCSLDAVPDGWLCDACRLGNIHQRVYRERKQTVDDSFVLQLAFLSNLSHRADMEEATKFHLAQWLDELEAVKQEGGPQQKDHLFLLEYWDKISPCGECLTEEGMNRMILTRAAKSSPLLLSFRKQISFLLKLMGDESSHSLRKLSLKAVEKVSLIPASSKLYRM